MIIVLGKFYDILARKLTDWECHRTKKDHENAMTHKMFWFQFCNYYIPLFYIAFMKGPLDRHPGDYFQFFGFRWQGCNGNSCMYELIIQLFTILFVKQFLFGFSEIIIPSMGFKLKKKKAGIRRHRGEYDNFMANQAF